MASPSPRSRLFHFSVVLSAGVFFLVVIWTVELGQLPVSTPSFPINSTLGDAFISHLSKWDIVSSMTGTRQRDCGVCSISPQLCEEWGEAGLARAMTYMGTGERFKRFLIKAREGKGFTMAVIGGSVSEGRGVDLDGANHTKYSPHNLHKVIFDHLNQLFSAPNGTVEGDGGRVEGTNRFVNGALGGQGSEYFSMCFKLHIPEDADLVSTELSINDGLSLEYIDSFELMVRSVLDIPHQPAMIYLQVLALASASILYGGDLHMGLLQHYDIPTVSLRNLILPQILEHNTLLRKWFFRKSSSTKSNYGEVDLRHISQLGHKLAGDLVNTYIDMQVCELDRWETKHGPATVQDFAPAKLSRLMISKPFDLHGKTPKLVTDCASAASDKKRLVPISSDGWAEGERKGKSYILSDQPGSAVTFKTRTTLGTIQVSALRSRTQGTGSAKCWVDGSKDKARRLDGYWDTPHTTPRSFMIATKLKAGDHTVTCELMDETLDPKGGKEFRIVAIMSI